MCNIMWKRRSPLIRTKLFVKCFQVKQSKIRRLLKKKNDNNKIRVASLRKFVYYITLILNFFSFNFIEYVCFDPRVRLSRVISMDVWVDGIRP